MKNKYIHNRLSVYVFALIILCAVASSSTVAPGPFGNVLVIISYVMFVLIAFLQNNLYIRGTRSVLAILFLLYSTFLLNILFVSISNGILAGFLLVTIFSAVVLIFVNFVNIFVIPNIVDISTFLWFISRFVAFLVIIALPSLFIGQYSLIIAEVEPYTYIIPFAWWGIEIPAITSIFGDSTRFSRIIVAGSLASGYEFLKYRKTRNAILFMLNTLGVYLSSSRGAMVATIIGLLMYYLYYYNMTKILKLVMYFGFLVTVYVILAIVGYVPGPRVVTHAPGRVSSWYSGLETIRENPIFGVGFGNMAEKIDYFSDRGRAGVSSSFIRVTVALGLVGGLSYIIFTLQSIRKGLTERGSNSSAIALSFVFSLTFLQAFESFTMFGINSTSIITALSYGYLFKYVLNDDDSNDSTD